jgi:hypothetical protein
MLGQGGVTNNPQKDNHLTKNQKKMDSVPGRRSFSFRIGNAKQSIKQ